MNWIQYSAVCSGRKRVMRSVRLRIPADTRKCSSSHITKKLERKSQSSSQ